METGSNEGKNGGKPMMHANRKRKRFWTFPLGCLTNETVAFFRHLDVKEDVLI